jgi:hypothetical protein
MPLAEMVERALARGSNRDSNLSDTEVTSEHPRPLERAEFDLR